MKSILLLLSCLLLSVISCTTAHHTTYGGTPTGQFKGNLILVWEGPDRFTFLRDVNAPFRFIRHDGEVIEPKKMITDGGSTPRVIWALKNYSPWGYGPAYVIHDWLFTAHRDDIEQPEDKHTLNTSADVLVEGVKTLMEAEPAMRNQFIFMSINVAVRTPVAQNIWDSELPDFAAAQKAVDEGKKVVIIRNFGE